LPTGTDLEHEARRFAAQVSELLNGTITTGVKLSAVLHPDGTCWVGRGVTRRNFELQSIPISIRQRKPRCFLMVAYVLQWDPEGTFLAVRKSNYGLHLDGSLRVTLLHYDYERSPGNDYPAAHLQVIGQSDGFDSLSNCTKELGRFHFPVGGRRFRPTLEDLIEFLVVEGLVDSYANWRTVLLEHRGRWERLQLQAAVRRDSEAAADALTDLGWICTAPPE
jgi:hypothetical protein